MIRILSIFLMAALLWSCGSTSSESKSEASDELSSRDKIRLKQYKIEGSKIYTTYCVSCHQADGQGLSALYPPLAGSDYLMEDLKRPGGAMR